METRSNSIDVDRHPTVRFGLLDGHVHTATHYTLHHTATHCNTRNTLQLTATHRNTLQHTATHYNTIELLDGDGHTATYYTLQHTSTHCNARNTLQHTATHCNTLQHNRTLKWRHPLALTRLTSNFSNPKLLDGDSTIDRPTVWSSESPFNSLTPTV